MILLDQAVSADHKQITKRMCSVGNTRQSRLKLAVRIFLTTVSSWSAINQYKECRKLLRQSRLKLALKILFFRVHGKIPPHVLASANFDWRRPSKSSIIQAHQLKVKPTSTQVGSSNQTDTLLFDTNTYLARETGSPFQKESMPISTRGRSSRLFWSSSLITPI
jgi:hypothetical protein